MGCSGYSSEKDRLLYTTEMDDYVIKPVTFDKLEQIMRLFYFDWFFLYSKNILLLILFFNGKFRVIKSHLYLWK